MGNSTKKKISLEEQQVQYLLGFPESGMGYQIVDVTLKDGRHLKDRVVVNSEFLLVEEHENIDSAAIEKIEIKKK